MKQEYFAKKKQKFWQNFIAPYHQDDPLDTQIYI